MASYRPDAESEQSGIRIPSFLSSSPCDSASAKACASPWGLGKRRRESAPNEGSGSLVARLENEDPPTAHSPRVGKPSAGKALGPAKTGDCNAHGGGFQGFTPKFLPGLTALRRS